MTQLRRIALAAGLFLLSSAALAADDSARCQVWQRELGFAKSVADRDPVAFAGFIHRDAAFGVGRTPTVGREAIVQEWQGIIDGSALKLEWYPDTVTVGGDGDIAYSSGPGLFQDPKTGAYRRSRFGSVWQRDSDGQWRVVFDDGTVPLPADAAAVQAFRDGSGKACLAD